MSNLRKSITTIASAVFGGCMFVVPVLIATSDLSTIAPYDAPYLIPYALLCGAGVAMFVLPIALCVAAVTTPPTLMLVDELKWPRPLVDVIGGSVAAFIVVRLAYDLAALFQPFADALDQSQRLFACVAAMIIGGMLGKVRHGLVGSPRPTGPVELAAKPLERPAWTWLRPPDGRFMLVWVMQLLKGAAAGFVLAVFVVWALLWIVPEKPQSLDLIALTFSTMTLLVQALLLGFVFLAPIWQLRPTGIHAVVAASVIGTLFGYLVGLPAPVDLPWQIIKGLGALCYGGGAFTIAWYSFSRQPARPADA